MYTYQDGKVEEDVEHTLNVVPGSGPRHMDFSKDGRFAYLVNEISNNLMVYKYNDKYLNLIPSYSYNAYRHFHGFSSASAIRLSATGNHLFISNRGHDSIVLYRVNQETGKFHYYMVHTGKNPRDFNIIDDKYLIVGARR